MLSLNNLAYFSKVAVCVSSESPFIISVAIVCPKSFSTVS